MRIIIDFDDSNIENLGEKLKRIEDYSLFHLKEIVFKTENTTEIEQEDL